MKKIKKINSKELSKELLAEDFRREISFLEYRIRYLDENRKPYPMYDYWIGTPQDKLRTKVSILEFLRDNNFSWKDEYWLYSSP
jgi:hypothetical protein